MKRVAAIVVLFMIASLTVAGCTINVFPTPSASPTSEPFTTLGLSHYQNQTNLTVGQTGTVTVTVTNHENANVNYTLVVTLANETINSTRFNVLSDQTWQSSIAFTPTQRGVGQKIEFDLYKGGNPEIGVYPSDVYRNVYFYINVT